MDLFYNRSLNKNFWNSNKEFNDAVREKLLEIANNFYNGLELDVEIDDIQLTGSLANYNYTKFSDLDVHILLDFKKVNDDKNLVKRALDGRRFIWNLRHHIVIRDYEVELYLQDTPEPHVASGLFSLSKNAWLVKPEYNPPSIDENDVNKKFEGIISDINELESRLKTKELSKNEAHELYELAGRYKTKIQKMRQRGLLREGEFSVENLVFKKLRNSGYIKTLIQTAIDAYDQIYSESISPFKDFYKLRQKNLEPFTLHRKYGTRQQRGITGGNRLHQNIVPAVHRADPTLNAAIEALKKSTTGTKPCNVKDLMYIINKYILQNDDDPCNQSNLGDMVVKYLRVPKNLGKSGIQIIPVSLKQRKFILKK